MSPQSFAQRVSGRKVNGILHPDHAVAAASARPPEQRSVVEREHACAGEAALLKAVTASQPYL
jgi:hypothetical protein